MLSNVMATRLPNLTDAEWELLADLFEHGVALRPNP